jgi:hypothetical protein
MIQKLEIAFWNVFIAAAHRPGVPVALLLFIVTILALAGVLTVARVSAADRHVRSKAPARQAAVPGAPAVKSSLVPEQGTQQPAVSAAQSNILLVLVDGLEQKSPALEGVWLVAHIADRPSLTFLPLYPASSVQAAARSTRLAQLFKLNERGDLDEQFKDAIRAGQIEWETTVLIDEQSIAELIDHTGGIDLGKGRIDGLVAVKQLLSPQQDPQTALQVQAHIIQQICPAAIETLHEADPKVEPGSHPAWLSCEFPTLQNWSSFVVSN